MTSQKTRIRPAVSSSDFPGIAAVISDSEPEPFSPEQVQDWFERMPPGRVTYRSVAVDERGEVIGYGAAVHESYHPAGHFYTWVVVHHKHRGQGIGAALFADAQRFLLTQGAASLQSEVRENCPAGLQFASQRGFRIDRHLFESTLDLEAFDETPFHTVTLVLETAGIRFRSYADFPDTTENRLRLHHLNAVTTVDVPGLNEPFMAFEDFCQAVFGGSWYRPEGVRIAVAGEEWVGVCTLELLPKSRGAYNLFTGVLPAYRERKIALALKLDAIRYARAHGAAYIRTNNDSMNAPMLAVNRKLGYQRQPGKYKLVKP
jgi:GNAT superfamily N-acetyltransferase